MSEPNVAVENNIDLSPVNKDIEEEQYKLYCKSSTSERGVDEHLEETKEQIDDLQ